MEDQKTELQHRIGRLRDEIQAADEMLPTSPPDLERIRQAIPLLSPQAQLSDAERQLAILEGRAPAANITKHVSHTPERLAGIPNAQINSQPITGFHHSPDFRDVRLNGEHYILTGREAQLIQILFDAYDTGTPNVSNAWILDRMGTGKRVRDVFSSKRRYLFEKLVRSDSKGTCRLNL